MSLSASALRKMMEMGLSAEQMVELAEALEEGFSASVPQLAERSAAAVRQARYRERKASKNESATRDVTRDVTDVTSPPLDKEKSPTPPKEINPRVFADASSERADDATWAIRLDEAKLVGGDGLNLTTPAMHSFRDLKALVEPASGEPCTWPEVLDAIRIEAAKAKTRGRPIRSWTWVRDTAVAMRDRRLAGLPAPTAPVELSHVRGSSAPTAADRRRAGYDDRLADIGSAAAAAVRESVRASRG